MEAGRRKQCANELCKKRFYPRVDPVSILLYDSLSKKYVTKTNNMSLPLCQQVVIMLVIDKENDRVLLGRQSRYVPRMWSCLAGFIEVCLYGFSLLEFLLHDF